MLFLHWYLTICFSGFNYVARLRDIIYGISILLEMITKLFEPFTRSLNHPVLPNGYSTLFALHISQKKGFESQEIFIYMSL